MDISRAFGSIKQDKKTSKRLRNKYKIGRRTKSQLLQDLGHTNGNNLKTLRRQTPRRKVLEQLTGSQLVKKFPAFYETRKFTTTLTDARNKVYFRKTKLMSTRDLYKTIGMCQNRKR